MLEDTAPARPRHFFILVRHAERADDPTIEEAIRKKQDEIVLEYDPQLSRPTGKQQAIKIGKELHSALFDLLGPSMLSQAEIYVFSSPFLSCIETAAGIMKPFGLSKLNVQDVLADLMMKGWYPLNEDPFMGLSTKLYQNKEMFTQFLKSQYEITVDDFEIEYKRTPKDVSYPETAEASQQRYSLFYRTIANKYF